MMTTIKSLLNKIKWDKNLDSEDFTLFYLDRISNKLIEIEYINILRLEGNFMVIEQKGKETYVPLHRIRKVKKKDKIVWSRQPH